MPSQKWPSYDTTYNHEVILSSHALTIPFTLLTLLFADNVKIVSPRSQIGLLQSSLYNVWKWSVNLGLSINPTKYAYLHLYCAGTVIYNSTYVEIALYFINLHIFAYRGPLWPTLPLNSIIIIIIINSIAFNANSLQSYYLTIDSMFAAVQFCVGSHIFLTRNMLITQNYW